MTGKRIVLYCSALFAVIGVLLVFAMTQNKELIHQTNKQEGIYSNEIVSDSVVEKEVIETLQIASLTPLPNFESAITDCDYQAIRERFNDYVKQPAVAETLRAYSLISQTERRFGETDTLASVADENFSPCALELTLRSKPTLSQDDYFADNGRLNMFRADVAILHDALAPGVMKYEQMIEGVTTTPMLADGAVLLRGMWADMLLSDDVVEFRMLDFTESRSYVPDIFDETDTKEQCPCHGELRFIFSDAISTSDIVRYVGREKDMIE